LRNRSIRTRVLRVTNPTASRKSDTSGHPSLNCRRTCQTVPADKTRLLFPHVIPWRNSRHVGPVLENGVAVVETQTIRTRRGDLFELHRKCVGRRRRSMRKNQRTGGDSRRSFGKHRTVRYEGLSADMRSTIVLSPNYKI